MEMEKKGSKNLIFCPLISLYHRVKVDKKCASLILFLVLCLFGSHSITYIFEIKITFLLYRPTSTSSRVASFGIYGKTQKKEISKKEHSI